ncbi:AI-2 transport protein TqsA [Defluviimonas aquaemixtae]|uniref:AI-2 transport protein TqsA n=1 Tax=Albidovulum aquaemixtae TaxID=1542388 RepID=A0A2R8BJN3_9RHOB|nr:AI-2E family transporter [Defluviimonas aquaemixtae]SPH23489.1 AI-2 transport protein TqsA [Defluviimonas aquaemixtae]
MSDPEAALATHTVAIRRYLGFIAFFCACIALFFAKQVVLPFVLAILLALTLSPVTRSLARLGVPPFFTAVILIAGVATTVAAGGYLLSGPVSDWIDDAPNIQRELEQRLRGVTQSIETVKKASDHVEELAETATDPGVVKVAIEQPGIVASAMLNVASFATTALVALILALFLLASGDMLYVKLVESFSRLSDKKRALKIAYGVEESISRYLLSITLINAGLGLVVGVGLALIGMPQPIVWGAVAFLFNFLPYVGAVAGIGLATIVAIVSFDSFGYAMLVPVFYFIATSIEGHVVTPVLVGRRLELNAVMIFATVVFWAWLWGFAGALLAVPFLVCLKVLCDNVPGLSVIGNFLGSSDIRGRYDPLRNEADA